MDTKRKIEKVGWSAADNSKLKQMKKDGYSESQIAKEMNKSATSVNAQWKRLEQTIASFNDRPVDPRNCYIIKKTDFVRSTVTVYKEVDIAFHGGSTKAWNYAMDIIRRANYKYREKEQFFWIKYK